MDRIAQELVKLAKHMVSSPSVWMHEEKTGNGLSVVVGVTFQTAVGVSEVVKAERAVKRKADYLRDRARELSISTRYNFAELTVNKRGMAEITCWVPMEIAGPLGTEEIQEFIRNLR